jgi:hypothetical protein
MDGEIAKELTTCQCGTNRFGMENTENARHLKKIGSFKTK